MATPFSLPSPLYPDLQFLVDKLRVHIYPNRQTLGQAAAIDVAHYIHYLQQRYPLERKVRIIFAAAPSQNEILATLCTTTIPIDWSRIEAFHMDEYIGLGSTAPQLFSNFLDLHLWYLVQPGTVHKLRSSGTSEEASNECNRYRSLLLSGPIDIVCLGIGENGHLAFNDPPVANFTDIDQVKIVELETVCRQQQVNDGCFTTLEDVPTHALTLTIPALLRGTRLFCCVPGKTKRNAIQNTLLNPEITTVCPATILRTHPDTTLYIDNGDGTDGKALGSFDTLTLLPLLQDRLSLKYIRGLLYNTTLRQFETMEIGIGTKIIRYIARQTSILNRVRDQGLKDNGKDVSSVASSSFSASTSSYLLPGLTDIQINGFNGIDFNTLGSFLTDNTDNLDNRSLTNSDSTGTGTDSSSSSSSSLSPLVSTLLTIARALLSHGITSFLPTLITNPLPLLESAVTAIHKACLTHPLLRSMIKGIHLEGPFISSVNGYRGCHKQEYCRVPDYAIIDKLQSLCGNRIVLITLAPELPGSVPFIREAVKNGIRIAIGHTNANEEEIQLAVTAGASLSTHLGNGIASTLPRHPNPLWSQLANDNLWCSLIADGQHLPVNVLKVMIRTKQNGNLWIDYRNPLYSKTILISDAVPLANMPPGTYNADSLGGEVVLTNDNRLYLQQDPSLLAGSVLTLDRAIAYGLTQSTLLTPTINDTESTWDQRLHTLWHMGSYNPMVYINGKDDPTCMESNEKDSGSITLGSIADIVKVTIEKETMNKIGIQQVWKEGELQYDKNDDKN